ncbi:bifunctional diaminohydroxyphosphoribosylaminopyrimidine deaminase/5-amino-6-(5-phosphoribosylamino)uracil reductase RibD [Hyphomicrobium sp.]|uniref:bifunctional diaminohydroxyphosphoribosylaminopyrimidine deaminase/5-amino-6-(5-phosphoribosylamino)uracil reductase RibD n=1 Tax=Hyphomicrobium sp. TaxID=82 RepID=UPI002D789591|nr:bifunctional diaminohydroxyphosphoribosylaminopyrimidine deaminase/5-amino-6-(5-phosphoribosylamino)uracil reductase RibD [Hyphomicrobium sp.]HET6390875.1 bifunctional diaminohydroxyphosphoribosylaminopyrimidine deaminase/5-amino-6-(5-phosphoribosylamino)uracil reductase RibD [Hyphomicrobium sp.]
MSSSPGSAFDDEMMAVALRMAERGLGATWPNPSVGAVIANEETGELISRARTANGGRPHAETTAIAAAGEKARGATIYVTLEPCSHYGQTGPCAGAIVAAGLKRAVVAIEDPDPRVAGRGLDMLREAGIEVVRGVGAAEAKWITRGHVVRITERRPLVTLKLALDAKGDIARGSGSQPVWVTGEQSRAHAMVLRSAYDAILVGAATVKDDDPELTCRLPGLFDRSPVRIVLSRSLDLPVKAKLFESAQKVPVWLMTAAGADANKKAAIAAGGTEVIDAGVVGGSLWLPSIMEALVARGITRLLVEGGPAIWRAFAEASLADEIILYMAGTPTDVEAENAVTRWLGPQGLSVAERRIIGTDTMWRLHALRTGRADKEGR